MVKKTIINRFDITALEDNFTKSAQKCPAPSGPFRTPELVEYVKGKKDWDGITYFTDKLLHLAPEVNSKIKVAILFEPPDLLPAIYEIIKQNESHYDLVFTHDITLIERNPEKYKFFPADIACIEDPSCKIHEKTKLVSILVSDKTQLFGHRLRHIIAKAIVPEMEYKKLDLYGPGVGNPVEYKSVACNDYMFQIAIENAKRRNYFTDKILDCFITGVIPIYWGCPNIGDYFDRRGILVFNTPKELKQILEDLTEEKYYSMLEYVKKNFETTKKNYTNSDDFLYKKVVEYLRLGRE